MASLAAKIAITICLTIFSILVLTIFFVVVFDQLYGDENYNYNKHHIKKGTVFANILLSKSHPHLSAIDFFFISTVLHK